MKMWVTFVTHTQTISEKSQQKLSKFETTATTPFKFQVVNIAINLKVYGAYLYGGGGPQVGEVTYPGGKNEKPRLHATLQPRHPGVHFLKIIEWSLST